MHTRLHGVFPPIATPFDADRDELDERALTENVKRWMTTGLAGVLALGSNGEAASLDEDESDRVVSLVRDVVPRDRVLLAGTGRESTRATIAASRRAAALGADAVLVRPPSYFKNQMTADVLVSHFTAVAESSPVPVMIYNLPGVTGITLGVPIIAKLADHPNIAGLKETSADLERLAQFTTIRRDKFSVLCGWAPVAYPALASGATGAILAVANVVPEACVALYEHVRDGRHADALELQQRLTPLAQLVTTIYGVPGLKLALDLAGYQGGSVRPPLVPPPSHARQEIAHALDAVRSTAKQGG